jgi:hypothetical protein
MALGANSHLYFCYKMQVMNQLLDDKVNTRPLKANVVNALSQR